MTNGTATEPWLSVIGIGDDGLAELTAAARTLMRFWLAGTGTSP